jgi:Zn-dependent peptidase ImmA (M78 family)
VFFLPEPQPRCEFRTLPEADLDTLARDTHLQIRRGHAYQLALKELFDGRNPAERPIGQTLSLFRKQPVPKQAQAVRRTLGIDLSTQAAWPNDDAALKAWRTAVEEAGVFVFKSAFKQKDISGYCLTDPEFPLIYLNASTTKTRQTFSLLHELAHLLCDVNGISKLEASYIDALSGTAQETERFCNAMAAEVLIPAEDFDAQSAVIPRDVEQLSDEQVAHLASRYGVSREAILRRFLDQGRVSKTFYQRKARFWASQIKPGGGGDWYASQNTYLSPRFARAVIREHYRQRLSAEQASELLGIRQKNFPGIEQRILQGAGS